jgi:hypothetical protein
LFYSRFRSFKTALPTFGMIALGSSLFHYWWLWLNSFASQYMIKKTLFISCQWTFHLHLVMLSESQAVFYQQFHITIRGVFVNNSICFIVGTISLIVSYHYIDLYISMLYSKILYCTWSILSFYYLLCTWIYCCDTSEHQNQ